MATLRACVEALTEIPEHPREGRPARQRAETRQAQPRPPARIKEPPPRTRDRRHERALADRIAMHKFSGRTAAC